MGDELSQLCPIQFIEGINENQEPIEPIEGRFWQPQDLQVAIPYEPSRTYTLSRIDIFGSPHELSQPKEHLVRLYTNNNNAPSDNFITEGKLAIPAEAAGEGWLQIDLQPIVVFPKQKYWIVLEEYSLKFAIGRAKDGKEMRKTGRKHGMMWVSIDQTIRYMLKFYGRVLPVVGQSA